MASAGSLAGASRRDDVAALSSYSPGELILKKLFAQFVVTAESKLKHVSTQQLANPLSKYIQRGDDPILDQLLASLKDVARFSLRSMLTILFEWRKRCMKEIQSRTTWTASTSDTSDSPQTLSKKEVEYYSERQQLAVEFIFCMTLTEILQQLPVHPVPENFIHTIEGLAFSHFKAQEPLKERSTNNPNVANAKRVADLYAEVVGVLSQVRFLSVRMRFFAELKNPQNSISVIISVIEGLSFVRVKMYPVEELEGWLKFLQDCANYMLESGKGEKVRHAMSALLVEVLTPVASVIKYEASMPAFKKIVSTLYSHAYDQAKRKHSAAYIPLVTVLLAISEDTYFLNNWHNFVLQIIIPNLKRNDPKLQWIALDSLYRLLWIYLIRIKGEGNVTTFQRLKPIIELLFPRSGGRGLLLKDFPPNIFVKIIHFIARERVDYAMPDIVVDLVTKRGTLNYERIIIGLRAFLMIADSLEKKEGDPPMPPALNSSSLSGSVTRTKTKFLTNTLTENIAKEIGIASYYLSVRQALSGILKQLDLSVGRPLVSTNSQVARAPEDALSGERKPKLDLLKTCVAAIPRLLPEGIGKEELIECLSRLTIHIDPELVKMSVTALMNIITNLPSWRPDIVQVYSVFVMRDIPDSTPLVLESSLKVLGQLLTHWKGIVSGTFDDISGSVGKAKEDHGSKKDQGSKVEVELPFTAMCSVEACALVTFCSYRSMTRRLSLAILKEVRSCLEALGAYKVEVGTAGNTSVSDTVRVLDIMERTTPAIIRSYLSILTQKERADLRVNQQNLSLWWLADRNACFLEHGGGKDSLRDAWSQCIIGLMEQTALPTSCPLAVQLAWPYILHRMIKAYSVLDNNFVPPERLDRAPQLRTPRGTFLSQPELFLWRNYLFFACCSAPPYSAPYPVPPTQGLYEAGMLLGDKHPRQYTARDLVYMIVPLIRTEGEIGEVVITALGLANPAAFGDLIEQFRPWIKDALDLRKSDNVKKKRRREIERVHITRVLSVAAGHGCFHLCQSALTKEGQVQQQILNFISGIKLFLESESERSVPAAPNSDLRLHYANLISSLINSFPEGSSRARLLPSNMRRDMFFMIAGWAGGFWHQTNEEADNKSSKQLRSTAFISSVLHAMSSLVCCGPFFEPEALIRARYIYRWLENMLCSSEEKIQQLGQNTVQLLLQYNREPVLLKWVTDNCYASNTSCASLCFHALCSTFAKNPSYPCNMITVLHVILYYTASQDHRTRERALQLLHILDRRFFASGERGSRRPELLGRITGSPYSNIHVAVSEELAFTNPELTLPLFSEMVRRFEEAPHLSRHVILQLMRPWLRNIELVEEIPRQQTSVMLDHALPSLVASKSTNPVLSGSGWGSVEGTHLVLHNLLYLTAKFGDVYSVDVECLWSALSTWTYNIRVILNYLARLSCLAGNTTAILKQAKRVMIYFSHTHPNIIIHELLRELHCVDLITAEMLPSEIPPFYRISGRGSETGSLKRDSSHHASTWSADEAPWAVNWRIEVRSNEGQATPLPSPHSMTFYASVKETLKLPCRQVAHLHRNNFALILLSEIVGDIVTFDWPTHLPVLLHVVTLGLDLHRPVIYQHSKKLLCSLTVLLACRDDYRAACEARLTQHEAFLHSPSLLSLTSNEGGGGDLQRCGSINSLNEGREGTSETSLARKARSLIKYISEREYKRCWPFVDLISYQKDCSSLPSCEVNDLCKLVDQILSVFQPSCNDSLKDKWSKIALQWATSCSSQQFASQSFQLCRALNVPLSTLMLREVLPRLAESVSDPSDELKNYVIEIMLSLENALNNSKEESLHPPGYLPEGHGRQISDITPLPEEDASAITSVSRDNMQNLSLTATPTFVRTLTPTYSLPSSSSTASSRLSSIPLAQSCRTSTPTSSIQQTGTTPTLEPAPEEAPQAPPTTISSRPHFAHHRRNHSRGQSVTNLQELKGDVVDHTHQKPEISEPPHVKETTDPTHSQHSEDPLPVAEQPPPHSPPAAGAGHYRHGNKMRLRTSASVDSDNVSHQMDSLQLNRVASSAREDRISAPQLKLMNLFEPLPGSGVQKAVSVTEKAGGHSHQHGRPYSEVYSNSISVPSNRMSNINPSVSGSLPSIATAKVMAPMNMPTISLPAGSSGTPTQLSVVHTQNNSMTTPTTSSVGPATPSQSTSSLTTPSSVITTSTHGSLISPQATPTIDEETSLDSPPGEAQKDTSSETTPPAKEAIPSLQEETSREESIGPQMTEGGGAGGGAVSMDTSGSSVDSTNIVRVPSHPELRTSPLKTHAITNNLYLPPDASPIMRAHSVSQLLQGSEGEEKGEQDKNYKRRSYSGSREMVPSYTSTSPLSSPSLLSKMPHSIRGSLDKLREKGHTSSGHISNSVPLTQTMTAPPIHHFPPPPLSHQNSPTKESLRRKISADPERERAQSAGTSRGKNRPRSMFETGSAHLSLSMIGGSDFSLMAALDMLTQLFWTSVSLMLSDYEIEFSLALRLFDRVTSKLDFKSDFTFTRLEVIRLKSKWEGFPGVLRVLLKGLSLTNTTHSTRRLISKVCPFVRRGVIDPSGSSGLPLCIMALLPELIQHFDNPMDELVSTAFNLAEACTSYIPQAQSNEHSQVLRDMGHLFTLYSRREFTNTCTIWLKSVCHYISKGYAQVTEEILKLMGTLLDQGCDTYHQSVLWILNEFLIKLEENSSVDMGLVTRTITRPVTQFIKGPLWQEALGILSLIVKNSSSLVQPTTPHMPMVDLGFFQESLPGPTLKFSVDLASGSHDLRLAHDSSPHSSWRRPQGCQRVTREKLLSIINACGPHPGLYSSPSIIFMDDQALNRITYSESSEEMEEEESGRESEEEMSSIRGSAEILDSSQPESAVINTIGDEFDFLNQYSDEEESEETELNIEGPFSAKKEEMYSSSLSSSQSSLYDEESELHQDHTHSSLEPLTHSIEVPHRKHSRSTSPYFPSASPQLHERSSRPHSLERSIDSIETTPQIAIVSTPPKREEFGLGHIKEVTEEQAKFIPEAPPTEAPPTEAITTSINVSGVSSSFGEETTPSLGEKTLVPDEALSLRETPTNEATPPVDETDSREQTLSPVPMVMGEEEEGGGAKVTISRSDSEDRQVKMESSGSSFDIITGGEEEEEEGDKKRKQDKEESFEKRESLEEEKERDKEIEEQKPLVEDEGEAERVKEDNRGGKEEENNGGEDEKRQEQEPQTVKKTESLEEDKEEKMEKRDELQVVHVEGEERNEELSASDKEAINGETVSGNIEKEETEREAEDEEGVDEERRQSLESQDSSLPQSPPTLSDNNLLSSLEETHPSNEDLDKPQPPDDIAPDKLQPPDITPPEPHPPDDVEPYPPDDIPVDPHPPDELQPSLSLEFSDEEDDEGGAVPLPPRVDLHRASHFICIADEEVGEMWQEHVSNLCRSKSLSLAVNTFYLFRRLFLVIRQQTCSLTQEAVSFMSESLWNISTHFLVTIELLSTQLEVPRIYLDTELISLTKLLDPLVFFALETQNNLEHFESQRTSLLQCIADCKQAVISSCSPPPLSPTSFSTHQKSLTLCHSIHQIHFQLLLLVSGYIKLYHLLRNSLQSLPVIDISSQLTQVQRQLVTILLDRSHDLVSGRLDREIEEQVVSLKPEQAMRYLQDTIAGNQPLLAIQLLQCMRSYFRDEQLFGIDSSDNLDVILYGYAHCLAEGQEGVIGLTESEYNISETHSHLMTQNVSLLSLLEKQQLPETLIATEL